MSEKVEFLRIRDDRDSYAAIVDGETIYRRVNETAEQFMQRIAER